MIRVAIAGCGHIAESHIRTLQSIAAVHVAGVCDLNLDQAREFAGRHGLAVAREDLNTVLRETTPDVVHILTPPASHRELATSVLEAGASALIEKPFAETRHDAAEMVRAEREQPGRLGVCHNYLHMPVMRKALQLIEQGALGRVISAEIYWRISSLDHGREAAQQWIEKLPGGAFQEVGPHVIYLLRAVLGNLTCVSARRAGNDELRVLFCAGEQLGALTISTAAAPIQKSLRIEGTRMSLQVDLGSNVLLRLRPRGRGVVSRAILNIESAGQLIAGTTGNVVRTLLGRMPRSHPAFVRAYYEQFANGLAPPATAADGLDVTVTLDHVWDAMQ